MVQIYGIYRKQKPSAGTWFKPLSYGYNGKKTQFLPSIIHHYSHWKEPEAWLIHALTHKERTYEGASKNEPAFFVSQQIPTITDCLPAHQEYKGKRFIQFKRKGACPSQIQSPASSLDSEVQQSRTLSSTVLSGLQRWLVWNQKVSDTAIFYLIVRHIFSNALVPIKLSPKEQQQQVKPLTHFYTYLTYFIKLSFPKTIFLSFRSVC